MKVTFQSPQKLGNRAYAAGAQDVPDSLAYNRAFKKLVVQGAVLVHPRDAAGQKIQLAKDVKALQKAQAARKAAQAARKAALAAQASVEAPASEPEAAPSAKGEIKPGKATSVSVSRPSRK